MNSRNLLPLLLLVAAALIVSGWVALAQGGGCPLAAKPRTELKPQTTCPVMGVKINKAVYADVKGARVYACCAACVPRIKAEPDKYLGKLKANGQKPERLADVKPATIEPNTLAVLLKSGVPLVVLDARTGKWDDGRRVPGAKSLGAKANAKQAASLVKAKDTLVVTYCSSTKCPASNQLAERLKGLGYTNVIEMPKGIKGWAEAGLKIDNVKK